MIRLVADENFNGHILRGVLQHNPELDIVRLQDTPLAGAEDPVILEWAAREGRILLTHDVTTMTDFAYRRLRRSEPMPGVVVMEEAVPVGRAIEDILLLVGASREAELENQIHFIPL